MLVVDRLISGVVMLEDNLIVCGFTLISNSLLFAINKDGDVDDLTAYCL